MSDGGQASDTFIGRLFKRIVPGSSYAAFPWRSWDKICTILETMRGRGIRIKRSTSDTKWELDATSGSVLDKPHAYSVYVHDPDDKEAKDSTEDNLPPVMRNVSTRTAFCYVPCFKDEDNDNDIIPAANGRDGVGHIGAMADDEWPDGSHWGWVAVGAVSSDDTMVVYGTLEQAEDANAPEFNDITIATEANFMTLMRSNGVSEAVPIAWVNGTNVVQTLCGRPWQACEIPPFTVRLRNLTNQMRIECYIPNRAGLVKLDGANAQASYGIVDGWNLVGFWTGSQTIVYIYLSTALGQTNWNFWVRTSTYTPSGKELTYPMPMVARITASGIVQQIHTGGYDLASVITKHNSYGTATELLDPYGAVAASMDGVAINTSQKVVAGGGIDVPDGAALDIKPGGSIRIGGNTYAPARVVIDGTSYTILAKA